MNDIFYYSFIIPGVGVLLYLVYKLIVTEYAGTKPKAIRALAKDEREYLQADGSDAAHRADLQGAVWIVRGPALPEGQYFFHPWVVRLFNRAEYDRVVAFKVGRMTFDVDRVVPAYRQLPQQLHSDDAVEVEFSPTTKTVWSIRRLAPSVPVGHAVR